MSINALNIDELMDLEIAKKYLSGRLYDGEITLFLGAGVSGDLGLPEWKEYVNDLRTETGLSQINDNNADVLQKGVDEVYRKYKNNENAYKNLLKQCLYRKMPLLSTSVLKSDLLLSIGGLLMGSKRGSVKRVVTLNYDSLIEWFLRIFGFVVKTVHDFPFVEGGEDVTVYHPHGFLPHPALSLFDSKKVLLSLDSVNERIGTIGDQWYELTRHMLRTGICVFVGMSENTFNDRAIAPLLTTVGKELNQKRPTGFWILPKDVKLVDTDSFLYHNVVPLCLGSKDQVPKFLFELCQNAALK